MTAEHAPLLFRIGYGGSPRPGLVGLGRARRSTTSSITISSVHAQRVPAAGVTRNHGGKVAPMEMQTSMKAHLDIKDAREFASTIVLLARQNIDFAADACGLVPAEEKPSHVLSTSLGMNVVETLLFVQGRRNASLEIADHITGAATMLWMVPEGEHRDALDRVVEEAAKKISVIPLEEETREIEPS